MNKVYLKDSFENCIIFCVINYIILIIDLLGDLLGNKPKLSSEVDTVIVIDHAPKVGPDRMEKLKMVLKKVVGRFGTILSEYYPLDENNVFKG